MNKYLEKFKSFLLLTTPIVASSVLLASPVKAATFAYSEGNVLFSEFSQSPSGVSTSTDREALALKGVVSAIAQAQAEANFVDEPSEASNSSLSVAFGENQDYLGIAQSEASILANFDIQANTDFSFNFLANFNLATSIDNPPQENARATGSIYFALIDTQNRNILDFFNLAGNITTPGNNDFVELQKSDNVFLSRIIREPGFGGLQEFLTVSIEGSLQRYFAGETTLALLEVKQNSVQVTAPEPSINLALLLATGVIGITINRRHGK